MEKKVVFFLPQQANFDRYGVLRAGSAVYAATLLKLGYFPVFVEIYRTKDANFFRRLLEDKNVVAFVSVGGLSLALAYSVDGKSRNGFEHFGKPYVSLVGDYPFYPWVRRSQAHEFTTKFSFYTEESSIELIESMIAIKGKHAYCPPSYIDLRYDRQRAMSGPAERDIPLLYVGSNWNALSARAEYLSEHGDMEIVFDAIVETALFDYHTPIWQHARRVLLDRGHAFDPSDRNTQSLLCAVNEFVSRRRRRLLMERLAKHPVHFVLGHARADLELHPDARILGPRTIMEILSLCERARAMVICLPNFAYGLSERMLYAMHRGAAVISTTNHVVERDFVAGEHLLTLAPDFADLDDRIAALDDHAVVRRLTDQARAIATDRYSPETIIGKHLAAVEGAKFEL